MTKTQTPAAQSAPATPTAQTSEPQHPPCTIDYHQSGRGCGWMRCHYCNEEYSLGQKIQHSTSWHFFPEAQQAYWEHCRSDRHMIALRISNMELAVMIAGMDEAFSKGKEYQKLMSNPATRALREILK